MTENTFPNAAQKVILDEFGASLWKSAEEHLVKLSKAAIDETGMLYNDGNGTHLGALVSIVMDTGNELQMFLLRPPILFSKKETTMTDTHQATPPQGQLLTGYGFIRLTAHVMDGPLKPTIYIRPSSIESLQEGVVTNAVPEETFTHIVMKRNGLISVKESPGEIFNLIELLNGPGSGAAR
jgi:hypothetical protein